MSVARCPKIDSFSRPRVRDLLKRHRAPICLALEAEHRGHEKRREFFGVHRPHRRLGEPHATLESGSRRVLRVLTNRKEKDGAQSEGEHKRRGQHACLAEHDRAGFSVSVAHEKIEHEEEADHHPAVVADLYVPGQELQTSEESEDA